MRARSGSAQIAYEVTGTGPDVLLIHAAVNDRRGWRHVIERLSPANRCIAFDMRRFGDTEYEAEEGWSTAQDAVAVLDAAGAERAVVIGGSMGGQGALDLALDHPERVAGLVLIGSAVSGAPEMEPGAADLDFIARYEAADEAGDLEEMNRLEAWFWLDGPHSAEGRVRGEARDLFLEMNGRALRRPDPGARAERPPAWPRLGEIDVPTLVLVGTLDAADVIAASEGLAPRIPGAELVRLDGVAHVPHLEGDPATLDAIEAFVSRGRSG